MPVRDSTSSTPVEVLLVEDNLGDIRLMQEAFKESNFPGHLSIVRDGEEAIEFLRRLGSYADSPRPSLILLDLRLPRKDGREVLSEIKQEKELRRIPVVVLSTSSSAEDVLSAYDLHANSYITKPVGLDNLVALSKTLECFWLSTAMIPA